MPRQSRAQLAATVAGTELVHTAGMTPGTGGYDFDDGPAFNHKKRESEKIFYLVYDRSLNKLLRFNPNKKKRLYSNLTAYEYTL